MSHEDFIRIPGLFRAWELEQVIEPGHEYLVATHGECPPDGTPLYTVHRRRTVLDQASPMQRRLNSEWANSLPEDDR